MREELEKLVASLEADQTKFDGGTNAAGSRMRKTLQEIRKTAQNMRVAILEKQKAAKAAKPAKAKK